MKNLEHKESATVVETIGATEVPKEATSTTSEQIKLPGVKPEERNFNLSDSETTYADALAAAASIQASSSIPAEMGLTKSTRSSFIPDRSPGKKVNILSFPNGAVITLRRNSGRVSEGITLTNKAFLQAFGKCLDTLPIKTQLTIILQDGRQLYGYVSSKERAYLPMGVWPKEITPPTPGLVLSLGVKTLIIG